MSKENIEEFAELAGVDQDFNRVLERYKESHRHYHTLDHLDSMFHFIMDRKEIISSPDALQVLFWATLYHDSIYNTSQGRSNCDTSNEDLSALLFQNDMSEALDAKVFYAANWLIKATENHEINSVVYTAVTEDEAMLFMDADMSILATDRGDYHRYMLAIRQEYQVVPDELYIEGRKNILGEFLSRSELFLHPQIRSELDHVARFNMQDELTLLSTKPEFFSVKS